MSEPVPLTAGRRPDPLSFQERRILKSDGAHNRRSPDRANASMAMRKAHRGAFNSHAPLWGSSITDPKVRNMRNFERESFVWRAREHLALAALTAKGLVS